MRILRRILIFLIVALLLGGALLASSFTAKRIDVSAYPEANTFSGNTVPSPSSLPDVSISLIECGKMYSKASFVYRGGSWSEQYQSGMAAVIVRHPLGSFLFDAGFGTNVRQHAASMPWLMQKLANYDPETPVAEQLRNAATSAPQLSRAFISHSHWDHVSGLEDFPDLEVWLTREEADYVERLPSRELIKQLQPRLKLHPFELSGPPYENFDRSLDLYGDGSVVFVPLEGHTPGSMGMFVNLRSGKRYLFTGDLTWALEGIEIPAERPWMSRRLVDVDEEQVRRSIVRVHNLILKYPDLIVVPAHDRRVHDRVTRFPDWES
ncbi:MAG TPA: MBL fold metallo-hydrolase [Blastocatellia bacterium]|nr:MBL fold metallo-hydrolase [Blastocatellia bacterium]